MKGYTEVIISIFNQYLHYFKFTPNGPRLDTTNKLYEIRFQTQFSPKSIFKIMDLEFLKGSLGPDMVEVAMLSQEFVGECENTNYSLPAIPQTCMITLCLDLTMEAGGKTSRVFSAEAFLKANVGPFSITNLHPTTNCMIGDNVSMNGSEI